MTERATDLATLVDLAGLGLVLAALLAVVALLALIWLAALSTVGLRRRLDALLAGQAAAARQRQALLARLGVEAGEAGEAEAPPPIPPPRGNWL